MPSSLPSQLPTSDDIDLMRRCLALARTANAERESPYACIIARGNTIVCETLNRVHRDRDITRHAEIAAVSAAQQTLGHTSLHDCTLYSIVEPCPMCAYAIREARIARVVYALRSPVMGGHSRWGILSDDGLSNAMPDVFAPPPMIVAGVLHDEADEAMTQWNALYWSVMKTRGLIVADFPAQAPAPTRRWWHGLMAMMRLQVIDRLWR